MQRMKVIELRDEWDLAHVGIGTRPDPVAGPGEIIVKMAAAAVNFRDTVLVRRGYGRLSGDLPIILLGDGAGHVVGTGEGVTRVKVGDLVCPIFAQSWISGPFKAEHGRGALGGPRDGVMQEYMRLSEQAVVKAPAHFTALQSATLPCAAVTAWSAVVGNGVKAGDVVVTQGTGGVSLFAMQFAHMLGATAVITSSSDEKLARAKALGADVTINYRTHPEWHREVRRLTDGRGADLVVELGGAETLEESLRAVRPSGTVALIGVLSGATAPLNLGRVVTQYVRLQGVTVGSRDNFEDMVRAIEAHRLVPGIDDRVYGFAETAAAIGAGGHFGKICIDFAG
jgi:NADPH:quinone reductase-like Zn-dependent oxidoreductase